MESSVSTQLTVPAIDSDINTLILDYLTTEGYSDAAAKFRKEANVRPHQEEESIKARQNIRHAIHLGHIEEALDALNELEPYVSTHYYFTFPSLCDD
jgi:glucose-induced degradation protein 8